MTAAQLKELKKRVHGLIVTSETVRKYFSTDASIFTITPEAVVYPRDAADVSGVVKYASEQATKGKHFSVIGRGKGSDVSGGALGDGAMVVFPAHMNKLLHLGKDAVTVQPGMSYGTLQKILLTHGRFLPPYPDSLEFCTVGGAVANNAGGEKTLKYGSTRDWVKSLKVILADGTQIETRRISGRELNRKKGLMTLEGDIYRGIDSLLIDNSALIKQSQPQTSKNSAGYALSKIKGRGGSFDLGQLFVGAQGTLGLVTEITLKTAEHNSKTTLVVGFFSDLQTVGRAVVELQRLRPSALEFADYHLLDSLRQHHPETAQGLLPDELPQAVVLVEFDNQSQLGQTLQSRRAVAILKKHAGSHRVTTKLKEQQALWRIRRQAAAAIWIHRGAKQALPIIEDAAVPPERIVEFLQESHRLLKKHRLGIAVWGHAGNGNFHIQPFFDLAKAKDRKTILQLMDEFYSMVVKLGGSTSGAHNDGLLRAPYLKKLYGQDMYDLFRQVKNICDPHGVFNPRIKLEVTTKDLETAMRREYSLEHIYDHLPHT